MSITKVGWARCLIRVRFNHSLDAWDVGFNSPLGQETSNCSAPALNSVNGETYTQKNVGRLNLPLD
jgi:hypothetical protein